MKIFILLCISFSALFAESSSTHLCHALPKERPNRNFAQKAPSKKESKEPSLLATFCEHLEAKSVINSNGKPVWITQSLLPFYSTQDTHQHTFFSQTQAAFHNRLFTVSPGFVYRYLPSSKNFLLGLNAFYDIQRHHLLQRMSIGADLISPWLQLGSNAYVPLSGWSSSYRKNTDTLWSIKPLKGYDVHINAPLPYLPWLRLEGEYYHFEALSLKNINGYGFKIKAALFGPLSLEGGLTRDNYTHNNFLQVSLRFGIPERIQYSLYETPRTKHPFSKRAPQRFHLEPINRKNFITNEARGISPTTSSVTSLAIEDSGGGGGGGGRGPGPDVD